MYKDKTFLCIIPARGGSKGIPRKNIVKINNKPLIQYTIDAAKSSKFVDRIIVSTEDHEIAFIAKQLGAEVPFYRPSYLSMDDSKTIDAVIFTIEELRKNKETYDYVLILQPTQPLRQSWHIDEAIIKIVNEKSDSLVSISKTREHPILMRTINKNGMLKNILQLNSTVRRQDFPEVYKVNGAIYINKISSLTPHTSLNDNKLPYFMDNKYDLDIDEPIDLEILKLFLKEN